MPDVHTFAGRPLLWSAWAFSAALAGCASTPSQVTGGAPVRDCVAVARDFHHPATRIVSAEPVAAGTQRLPGLAEPMPAHCVVKGVMHERVSAVDGKPYAIGFEMRLPWLAERLRIRRHAAQPAATPGSAGAGVPAAIA